MKKSLESFFLKTHHKMMLVLLIITYFLVLGPTAIYLRLVNHRKLPKDDFEKDTTWVDVPEQTVPLQDHLKQF